MCTPMPFRHPSYIYACHFKCAAMLNQERFQILLNNYTAGISGSPERRELFVMVGSGEYLGLLDQHVSTTLQAHVSEGPSLSATDKQAILQRVFAGSQRTPVVTMRPGRSYIRWVAAAAVLAAIGGAYLWFHQSTVPEIAAGANASPAKQELIVPGGYKATLTLADASIVNLDGVQNGQLPRQGNTELSIPGSGQLEYKSQGSDKEILYNKITTPRGGQYKVVLPDGSKVWLNAASSLRFPIAFAGDERSVLLTGEAYFEINPQPAPGGNGKKLPFTVNANGVKVSVLGTHFDVMAYTDEATLQTTLLEGSVKVSSGNASGLLKPGQQAQVQDGKIKVVKTDAESTVAWKDGFFNFEQGADVTEVMKQIARWYNVDVVYEQSVPRREFEGKIARDEKIADLVKILETNNINVRLDEKERRIIVMP